MLVGNFGNQLFAIQLDASNAAAVDHIPCGCDAKALPSSDARADARRQLSECAYAKVSSHGRR
jgi:hypothetical protein